MTDVRAPQPCTWGECTTAPARPFLPGWRCSEHTPARLAGRPEPPDHGSTFYDRDERAEMIARDRLAARVDRMEAFTGRRVTSRDAAAKVLPKTGTQRRAVLDAIVEAYTRGHGGATDPELQRHLSLPPNSMRPRRVELAQAGLVDDSGKRRRHQGNEHIVWQPTSGALAATGYKPPDEYAERANRYP